jgi:hypothetical protein
LRCAFDQSAPQPLAYRVGFRWRPLPEALTGFHAEFALLDQRVKKRCVCGVTSRSGISVS